MEFEDVEWYGSGRDEWEVKWVVSCSEAHRITQPGT